MLIHDSKIEPRDFPGSPVVDSVLPVQRPWVLSLIRELRSHMLHGLKNKIEKKKKKERKKNRNDRTTIVINTEIIRYSSPIKSLKIFNNEATNDYVIYIFYLL